MALPPAPPVPLDEALLDDEVVVDEELVDDEVVDDEVVVDEELVDVVVLEEVDVVLLVAVALGAGPRRPAGPPVVVKTDAPPSRARPKSRLQVSLLQSAVQVLPTSQVAGQLPLAQVSAQLHPAGHVQVLLEQDSWQHSPPRTRSAWSSRWWQSPAALLDEDVPPPLPVDEVVVVDEALVDEALVDDPVAPPLPIEVVLDEDDVVPPVPVAVVVPDPVVVAPDRGRRVSNQSRCRRSRPTGPRSGSRSPEGPPRPARGPRPPQRPRPLPVCDRGGVESSAEPTRARPSAGVAARWGHVTPYA